MNYILPLFLTITYCGFQNSYQKLYVQDNILTLQFYLYNQILPIPLRQLDKNQNIQKYTYPFHISFGSKWNKNIEYPQNGIRASIRINQNNNYKQISQYQREGMQNTLFDIFSISKQTKYYHLVEKNLNQKYQEYYDPNDKFCVHHIQQIIRNFLPCQTNSGIAQLIKTQQFFTRGYVGTQINWQKQSLIIKIFVQIQKQNTLLNLKKIKIIQKCQYFNDIIMLDINKQNIYLNQVVINRILQSNKIKSQQQPKHQPILINKRIIGNWYNPYKTLLLQIYFNLTGYYKVSIPQILPDGCQIIDMKVYYLDQNYTQNIISSSSSFNTKQIPQKYYVQTKVLTKVKNFDIYQSIYGGGQEIPSFFILFNQTNSLKQVLPPLTTIRVPQPDFSIPFQVMTFTAAAIGYLWLSLWRVYFAYCQ